MPQKITQTVLMFLLVTVCQAIGLSDQPNVILIMTDDQGYGDLSATGNTIVQTPNMDRLAQEGAWFKQFYVSPVCTPTRAHLMTGRYHFRTRAIDTYLGRAVMEPNELTLAEVMNANGYATGIFGKWHLGDFYPTRAADQGFSESLVHQGGGLRQPANPPEGDRYHDPILFHNGTPERHEGFCTDIFFDKAIEFIETQSSANKPFFAYIPTNAPHGPFDEPPTRELLETYVKKLPNEKNSRKAAFYAMIKNVDINMGRLFAKLEQLEIEDNTIVIFLTDNGPSAGSAGPFRGNKGTIFEGGIRTVCFVRWPGKIVADSSSQTTAAHIDLMPTILDLCQISVPANAKLDGRSLRPLLQEVGVKKIVTWEDRHLFLQWHRGDEPQAFQSFAAIGPKGRWKLLNASNRGRHLMTKQPEFQLFDLQNDIAETKNVASQHPEIVANLKKEYMAWFNDVGNTRSPNFGMPPVVIGSQMQPSVILTPQDKRVANPEGQGWRTDGFWPVDVQAKGPYNFMIRLDRDAPEDLEVQLDFLVGNQSMTQNVTVLRGLKTATFGNFIFPAAGKGKVIAKVLNGKKNGAYVYQVTIK